MDLSKKEVNKKAAARARVSARNLADKLPPERLANVKDASLRQELQEVANSARAVVEAEGRAAFVGSATAVTSSIFGFSNQHASEGDGKCASNCIDGFVECLEAMAELMLGEDLKFDPDEDKVEVETDDGSIILDIGEYDAEHSDSPNDDDDPMNWTEASEALRDKYGEDTVTLVRANCAINYGICLLDCLVPG